MFSNNSWRDILSRNESKVIAMHIEKILEKNNYLFNNEEIEKRLKTGEYKLIVGYEKDKKFIIYNIPLVPLYITPLMFKL